MITPSLELKPHVSTDSQLGGWLFSGITMPIYTKQNYGTYVPHTMLLTP